MYFEGRKSKGKQSNDTFDAFRMIHCTQAAHQLTRVQWKRNHSATFFTGCSPHDHHDTLDPPLCTVMTSDPSNDNDDADDDEYEGGDPPLHVPGGGVPAAAAGVCGAWKTTFQGVGELVQNSNLLIREDFKLISYISATLLCSFGIQIIDIF